MPGDVLEQEGLLGGELLVVKGQNSFSLAVWFLNDLSHLYLMCFTSDSDFDLCLKLEIYYICELFLKIMIPFRILCFFN